MAKTGPLQLLLVDDDPEIHRLVGSFLGDTYDVRRAESVGEARELLTELRPDLLLLDVYLDEDLGTDLLRGIRSSAQLAHVRDVPVVMLSSATEGRVYEEAWWLGSTAFVSKPLDYGALSAAVRSALAA